MQFDLTEAVKSSTEGGGGDAGVEVKDCIMTCTTGDGSSRPSRKAKKTREGKSGVPGGGGSSSSSAGVAGEAHAGRQSRRIPDDIQDDGEGSDGDDIVL